MNPRGFKPSQHDPMSGAFLKHELWERRCRLGETAFYLDRDVMAALNLVHADVTTNTYDSEALARAPLQPIRKEGVAPGCARLGRFA